MPQIRWLLQGNTWCQSDRAQRWNGINLMRLARQRTPRTCSSAAMSSRLCSGMGILPIFSMTSATSDLSFGSSPGFESRTHACTRSQLSIAVGCRLVTPFKIKPEHAEQRHLTSMQVASQGRPPKPVTDRQRLGLPAWAAAGPGCRPAPGTAAAPCPRGCGLSACPAPRRLCGCASAAGHRRLLRASGQHAT